MFGPQLEPPPSPPPAEVTTFDEQYAPDVREVTAGGEDQAAGKRLSVSLNVTLTSDYTFRGLAQRHDRPSIQPGGELAYRVCDTEHTSTSVFAGLWGDFRVNDLGSGEGIGERFYELDLYAGAEFAWKRLTTRATFTEYTSPTGDFARIHEASVGVSFDDSGLYHGWFERFSLNPSALVAFEFGPDGADGGAHAGVFLSLGVEPTIALGQTRLGKVSISAPVEVGLSLHDYYETATGDKTYGYLNVGGRLTIEPGGVWPVITLAADYTDFGPGAETINGRGGEFSVWMDMAWSF
ncbi:MAG: TorF family putative porin [Phycisphaerales bacterium]